jgi:protein-tyrosine phosphatase
MIDIHSHILPGLDDGASDLETALQMARMAVADGIRTIIATPHTDPLRGEPSPDLVRERVAAFAAVLEREGIELQVLPGAENVLSDNLVEALRDGKVLTLGDRGKYVLIELPFGGYPTFIPELMFNIQLQGFLPVLAHPERSAMNRANPSAIQELVDKGARLQVNADSLLGRGGRAVMVLAQRLARNKAIWAVASDAHDLRSRPPQLSPVRKALRKLGGDLAFDDYTQINPAKILRVTPPPPPFQAPPAAP